MERIRNLVKKLAPSKVPLLLCGESGVGKSFLARTIHRLSGRDGDFVAVRYDSQTVDQIGAEFFGCEKGAFSWAIEARVGLIEAANGGTLFLDEVGAMPLHLQIGLTRAMDRGSFTRVGSTKPCPVDVRLICGTSQNLEAACSTGAFLTDLYRRLGKFVLEIPPLRERTDEIAQLADIFIRDICGESDRRPMPQLTPDAIENLRRYSWPGNIGELKQVIKRALLLCQGPEIVPTHLTIGLSAALNESQSPEVRSGLTSGVSPQRGRGRRCSLCGQVEQDVRKLISGPHVFICDECVGEAQKTLFAAMAGSVSAKGVRDVPVTRDLEVSCAFCGKMSSEVRHLVGGEKALICDECLDLCDEILAERLSGEWPPDIGDARPLKALRLVDRYWIRSPERARDLGVMSPEEALEHARSANMILRATGGPGSGEVPTYALAEADGDHRDDDPLVVPRKTLTLRASYPEATIEARLALACEELCHDNPCRIVIIVDGEGELVQARLLLDRVKKALNEVATFHECEVASPGAALTSIAIPGPGSDRGF